MTVHFKTRIAPRLKAIAFKDFDFSCETPSQVIDLNTGQEGDLGGHFVDYSTVLNRKLVGESFRGTKFLKDISDKDLDEFAKYPESITCRKRAGK
jgi:hypothetical protein